MPKYYSKDMRAAALQCVEGGKSRSDIIEFFGISLKTLSNWIRLDKSGLDLLPNKRTSYHCSKGLCDALLQEIFDTPDILLEELSKKYERSQSTIHYHLKKLGITHKKNYALQEARREKKTSVFGRDCTAQP